MNRLDVFCPFCFKMHTVLVKEEKRKLEFKHKVIEYMNESYYCEDQNEEFEDEELGNNNLIKIADEYRKTENLLTTKEIKDILIKYNISQKDLAILLNMGEVTITRYVTGVVQEKTNNSLLEVARDNPKFLLENLKSKEEILGKKKTEKLRKNIIKYLEKKNDYLISIIEDKYQLTTDIQRGNVNFNKNKFLEILKRFVDFFGKISKVKLAKMLWYCDFSFFKKYNIGITGISYAHMQYGALPYCFNQLIEFEEIIKKTEIEEDSEITHIKDVNINEQYLSEQEVSVVNQVMHKFENMTTQEIVEYMHQEVAYHKTIENKPISYEYAKYLREF